MTLTDLIVIGAWSLAALQLLRLSAAIVARWERHVAERRLREIAAALESLSKAMEEAKDKE